MNDVRNLPVFSIFRGGVVRCLACEYLVSEKRDYEEAQALIDAIVWLAASAGEGRGKTSAAR